MTIQQVASGSSSGIMSFLFQDDGSAEGTVLEGAEFARTLHQLLGESEAETMEAKTPMSAELASVITDTEGELKELTAPLTQGLESLIKDFKLPEHSAKLPPEAGFEGEADGQEVEQPFWGIAPFTDVMSALREHTGTLHGTAAGMDGGQAANDGAALPQAEAPGPAVPTAPVFGSGIAHVIEMARDAAQLSAELNQQATATALPSQPNTGRNAPLAGKVLPQGFRTGPSVSNAGPTTLGSKASMASPSGDIAMATQTGEATVSNGFFTNLLNVNADAPAQQGSAAQTQTMAQGVHALHAQNPVANLPKATDTAPAGPPPQMQSQHPVGSEAWFQDLGARVDWLKDMKVEKAELQLHPAELGLLEIHISAGDDATTVSFITHNSEARNLIEDNMPRLRELLASQGMQLGESQVSQHSEGQRRGQEAPAGTGSTQRDATADDPAPIRHRAYIADPNRIDHYV